MSHLSKAEAAKTEDANDTTWPATKLATTVITRTVTGEFNCFSDFAFFSHIL